MSWKTNAISFPGDDFNGTESHNNCLIKVTQKAPNWLSRRKFEKSKNLKSNKKFLGNAKQTEWCRTFVGFSASVVSLVHSRRHSRYYETELYYYFGSCWDLRFFDAEVSIICYGERISRGIISIANIFVIMERVFFSLHHYFLWFFVSAFRWSSWKSEVLLKLI